MPSRPPRRANRPASSGPTCPNCAGRAHISSILSVDTDFVIVRSMDLAVYMYMLRQREEIELLDVVRVGRFSHEFFFGMRETGDAMIAKARRIEMQFANSSEAKSFANAQRDLKSFMRRIDNERPGQGRSK